jgi:hypothetical protein
VSALSEMVGPCNVIYPIVVLNKPRNVERVDYGEQKFGESVRLSV